MTDLAAESQTDRIVRLALLAGGRRLAIERVEALHRDRYGWCAYCNVPFPCETRRTLDGDTAGHEQARAGEVGT